MSNISFGRAMFLWSLASIFFAFQFILRLSAGLLREEIMQKFAVDSANFGTLAGYYYLGYSISQIPLGIMLDRLSFRFVTFIAIATTALGTLLFVKTNSWNLVLLSRFLIGAGSGVAFLSVAKVIKSCFEAKYHSPMLGFSFSFGLIGAVFGATPMKYFFDKLGFEHVFNLLALIGFAIALLILLLGRVQNKKDAQESLKKSLSSIKKLLFNPILLIIGISGGLMVGSLEGFADVWAIPFFSQSFNISKTDSTTITSFVYIGMCFGGPILTLIAGILRSANLTISLTGLVTIAIFLILFYLPVQYFNFISCSILMFILGILCCYQVLVFILVNNIVEEKSTGLAIAIINCINMSFGHFFHTIIGKLFQLSWNGTVTESGHAIYSHDNFVYAMSIIPICAFIGLIGFTVILKLSVSNSKHC